MMDRMGFGPKWRRVVLNCISTTIMLVLVNRVPTGQIIPQRGLRQGCPLSPYLFLLCAEDILGFSCKQSCPRVSQIFFADDTLIFCRANQHDSTTINSVLNIYEAASRQQISINKSSVCFSPNVDSNTSAELITVLGVGIAGLHDRYLSLPSLIGRSK